MNNIWTFGTTYNGYAWFPTKTAPMAEGLDYNFTKVTTDKAHEKGLEVFAYFCLGGNPYLQTAKPQWCRQPKEAEGINMIFTDEYLEYFCTLLKEGIAAADFDGVVIDWFRKPFKVRDIWVETERKLYEKLTGKKFPESGTPSDDDIILYERLSIENAWRKIKSAVDSCNRKVKIWTNQPFDMIDDPVWNDNILMKEVDYLLNEGPDFGLLNWLKSQSGSHTIIVQNLCGWPDHSMEEFDKIDLEQFGLFGFAAADPKTGLPFEETNEIDRKLENTNLTIQERERLEHAKRAILVNKANIKIIKEIYNKEV